MAKFTGKLAEISVIGSGATPTFKAIAQVQEIGDINVTAEEVDVTTLDAGDYRDYISGFKDPGECELSVIWDANLADHGDEADGLVGLFASGDTREWAIRWNSSAVGGATYGVFSGFIRDNTYGALNADDPQTLGPVIRLTSAIVLSDVMPTTRQGARDLIKSSIEKLRKRRAELAAQEAAAAQQPVQQAA